MIKVSETKFRENRRVDLQSFIDFCVQIRVREALKPPGGEFD